MKLLIITQKMDQDDPVLGFFVRWVNALAASFDSIDVTCLQKGKADVAKNVSVYSLGKEEGKSKLTYVLRFYSYIWNRRKNYDAVFVHMNQEYVLLGGKIWFLLGKKVYMWRNHPSGTLLTDVAAFFCDKIFCTSKVSYTARFKKTVLMPVGVDTREFAQTDVPPAANSILFLGRIAPVKRPDLLLKALSLTKKNWTLTIVGDPLSADQPYTDGLRKLCANYGIENKVTWQKAVTNKEAAGLFRTHEIYINLSPSGMFDKTIIEAMASGSLVLASNSNLKNKVDEQLVIDELDAEKIAQKIDALLLLPPTEKKRLQDEERIYAETQSLAILAERLSSEIKDNRKDLLSATILRYVFAGSIGALSNLLFLYILADIVGIYYLYAAIVAFILASIVSFILQKYWTFGNGDRKRITSQFSYYTVISVISLLINTALMYLFVSVFGIWHMAAQCLASILIAILNFFLYKKIFS